MDFHFYKQVLTFCILNLVFMSLVCGNDGKCRRKKWIENEYYEVEIFCCSSFEMKNGTCTACQKGYTSDSGGKCHPCTEIMYGTRCLQTCDCTEPQTCHHIDGCIQLQSNGIQTTSEDNINVHYRMTIPGSELEEADTTEVNHETTPLNHNFLHVIYSVCITGLVVVIAICYICIRRLKDEKTEQKQDNSSQRNETQNALNVSLPFHESTIRLESIYDEIDEVSLHNAEELPSSYCNVVSESSSNKISDSEKENMEDDDYLNPYQPIVEDSNEHDYKTLNVSSSHLDRNEDINIVHKGNVESLLQNVTTHQYIDVIFDPRYEYPIYTCITSSSAYGSSNQSHKQVQCADTINKQTSENLQTSKLNRSHSNKDNLKEDKENRKLSSSVPIKRLTI